MKLTKEKLKQIIIEEFDNVNESGVMYRAGVKRYSKEGMKKIQQAVLFLT